MKLNINELEKERIIKLHKVIKETLNSNLNKKIINEQTPTQLKGVDLLNAAKSNQKCKFTFGGRAQNAPGKPTVLFKIADYDSKNGYFVKGDSIYIKDDFTFDVVRNEKLITTNKPWKCDALFVAAPDQNAEDIKKEIAAGWKKREDIPVSDSELATLYRKHPKYNLYTLIINKDKSGDYTPEQQAFVKAWVDKGYKDILLPEERAAGTWEQVLIPGSDTIFPGGKKMWRNSIGDEDRSDCRSKVKQFYKMWSQRRTDMPAAEFDKLKQEVQGCKNQHYGKWGVLGGGNKLDRYLDELSGKVSGGTPSSSPYRLQ
jgi:hypothetical protein